VRAKKKRLSLSSSLPLLLSLFPFSLLALDRPIHPPHKAQTAPPPDKAQHQAQRPAADPGVPEEERALHQALHVRLGEEEVDSVGRDEQARGGAAGEGAPPPPVVLRGELDCWGACGGRRKKEEEFQR
jgi:hypothetical protein